MRSLSGPTTTALGSDGLAIVQLVYMAFTVPIALNSSNWGLVFSGVTYKGAYGLGSINTIEDSPGEIKGLSLQLIGVDSASVALALDDSNVVQGTPITIRTAILNSSYQIVDAPIEWDGKLDTMSIEEDGDKCTISVTAESSAVDLLRGSALTYSLADQLSLYPGDITFQFVSQQANTPVVWPSKTWLTLTSGQR